MKRATGVPAEVSGRFVLRIDPVLHASLKRAARQARLSLNEYCGRKLAAPSAAIDDGPASVLMSRAAVIHGMHLVGIVAFGSWARGEAGPSSDVDALVVLEATMPLKRSLYRAWDDEPVIWGGRVVEPHLVHLPDSGVPGTLWAEAAIDGIVLFERDLRISRHLASVRREIAEGRLIRRSIHGQPYWATEVA